MNKPPIIIPVDETESPVRKPVRTGWIDASKEIAEIDDDVLVLGEFPNEADTELTW